jgi:mannose-6-phosphate isomerase-like protein (cupin superfamily)
VSPFALWRQILASIAATDRVTEIFLRRNRVCVSPKQWGHTGNKMQEFTHAVRKEDLPLIGSSYNFVGAEQGDVAISMFLVEAQLGRGAPLHIHEYDEIVLVQEGMSRFVIGELIREALPGDILVVKARTPHGFVNAGSGILKQLDIHVSPRFRQELVESTETSRRAGLPLSS